MIKVGNDDESDNKDYCLTDLYDDNALVMLVNASNFVRWMGLEHRVHLKRDTLIEDVAGAAVATAKIEKGQIGLRETICKVLDIISTKALVTTDKHTAKMKNLNQLHGGPPPLVDLMASIAAPLCSLLTFSTITLKLMILK
ncbi:hypothetical protein Glove_236g21 [Diversispora epigaea]|uniref:Uncharacterized protein n=1 Tax=Diversispora epigaea TaxID=1348612 RepID=A0A397IJM5_9GLOM|nr:hypothetical protein Glove_236g21 [Diversispora epigaea]